MKKEAEKQKTLDIRRYIADGTVMAQKSICFLVDKHPEMHSEIMTDVGYFQYATSAKMWIL